MLARAGYKLENRPATEWEECPVWAKLHREREWNTFHKSKTLISLRTQWIEDADLVDEPRSTTVNLDFDMKRALVDPTDVEGVITAATRPWASVEEFTACRDGLESWKKAQRRVLKTVDDLGAMRAWFAARPGQKASGSTAQSRRPPLVNAFLKAVTRGRIDQGLWTHASLKACLARCGWPVGLSTIKMSKLRGKLTLGAIAALTPEDVRFAEAFYRDNPGGDLAPLVAEGSAADKALKRLREALLNKAA